MTENWREKSAADILNNAFFEAETEKCRLRTFKVGDAVQTRDGRKARIIADDVARTSDKRTLAVLVTLGDGSETLSAYRADGRLDWEFEDKWDLVPLPRKRTVWVTWWASPDNITKEFVVRDHPYGYSAQVAKKDGALACMRFELVEGQFDD